MVRSLHQSSLIYFLGSLLFCYSEKLRILGWGKYTAMLRRTLCSVLVVLEGHMGFWNHMGGCEQGKCPLYTTIALAQELYFSPTFGM